LIVFRKTVEDGLNPQLPCSNNITMETWYRLTQDLQENGR